METLNVSCNQCGAPLEVPRGTRFLTCNYCSARLEVHQSESASYTSVLEAIQEQTARMAQELGAIRLQNELEQLDRQWTIERTQYLVRQKNGTTSEPGVSVAGLLFVCLFTLFFVTVTGGIGVSAVVLGAPGILAFVAFAMAVFAVVAFVSILVSSIQRVTQYAEARRQYENRRAKLLDQIDRQNGLGGRAAKSSDD
ncbi:MAG: hypothetical protein ABFD16_17260 [Thermoguttaceae bacterium]